MTKHVKIYVEGKSDQIFFEGSRFNQFVSPLGYSLRTKNLRTKGNVVVNFEKFLKIQEKDIFATVLVYDQDNKYLNTKKLEEITRKYNRTFHCVAIQELEAWFIADHVQLRIIDKRVNTLKDTHAVCDPKTFLKNLFHKSGKGYKNEIGFAEYFCDKIDFAEARKHNKSLNRFLNLFENKFESKSCA
jgi:Domain of unknown function (DUF4276)